MKPLIWMGTVAGSIIGGLIPELWGASAFSFSSLLCGTIGALAGIYVTYKMTH